MPAKLTQQERTRRLVVARRVAIDGGNIARFVEVAGLTYDGGYQWLRANGGPLYLALRDPRCPRPLKAEQALHRLMLVRDARARDETDASAAHRLGITGAALSIWLQRWAPDSIDQAIADLEPEPELEEAA